ncbi:hypothetical protein TrLO_g9894 [Triparma laevis f. longispina]|uniref:Uncharacterized protein n=1 Tax=Triparma laevis f. longispina TaxID=1714387 RepID=A0A9W7FE02_9STRA|nr:hypothetical protein TrLO_g9894 [Triparma laevis f. longispina]
MLKEKDVKLKVKDIELKEKDAALKAHEAYRAQTEAAREKFSSAINALNQEKEALKDKLKKLDAAAPASEFRPLNFDNPNVTKFDNNVVSSSITTTNCSFGSRIHEPPEEVFDALFGEFTNATNKMLYQKACVGERGDESVVLFWSFVVDQMKSCELALRLKKVEGSEGEGEIIIEVKSVEEEELETMTLPNPHSTAKKRMLILSKGAIILRGVQFGQTLLTFSAQVEVCEGRNNGAGGKADELFYYSRFG